MTHLVKLHTLAGQFRAELDDEKLGRLLAQWRAAVAGTPGARTYTADCPDQTWTIQIDLTSVLVITHRPES